MLQLLSVERAHAPAHWPQVERLQAKFEIMSAKSRGAGEVDENGEPRSQAYYVIKAAQEREALQREVRGWEGGGQHGCRQ